MTRMAENGGGAPHPRNQNAPCRLLSNSVTPIASAKDQQQGVKFRCPPLAPIQARPSPVAVVSVAVTMRTRA